jgi:multidrug efflux pump subunit AcrA (membrane-fusion protein)
MEQALARLAAEARRAELNQADIDIARRKVLAPLSGTVVDVKRRAGEWVNPGDSVFRIVQLDRLRVEAFVDSTRYSHEELENQPMRVEVTFPRGRKELFTGRVVFVDPQILQPGGLYRVWAEVENRKNAKDQWVLQPGRHVVMEITLPPVAD